VIVLDASALFAALDADQPEHGACRGTIESDRGPFLLSPFVLAEVDYFISTRVGLTAETALLRDVAAGAYRLEPFDQEDIRIAIGLIERYADLRLGLADASVVALAARAGTNRILTLDERHFRALRPLAGGRSFKVLPADR
jgi:predicted nucleic acid-binding protein